jgi:uncharacterized Ntn-hydrolase superfamily protein
MVTKREWSTQRPVATYSIIARDPATGEYGVGVQSHWFSVGSIVPWAEAGVGAVATQSFVEPSYGPLGLALMKTGKSASETLRGLLAADPQKETRQVAMIDASGAVAVHTGSRCVEAAGHAVGKNVSVQANMMSSDAIWPAMKNRFEATEGDLADRLVAALEAAENAGGDARGKQSAALLVVRGTSTGSSWIDRRFDLRIEDHPEPLDELKRLLRLSRAYEHAGRGDDRAAENKIADAHEEYAAAAALAPKIVEFPFWHAVALAAAGEVEKAAPIFADVFKKEPRWRTFVERLPKAGLLPDDPDLVNAIRKIGKK